MRRLGGFVQPDTIIPSIAGPQTCNRYSYANNNPVFYNDPSGHVSCSGSNWDDGPQCKGKAEFQQKAADELKRIQGRRSRDGWENDPAFVSSFDGGWASPEYTNWNLLRMGSGCTACHITHWTGTIPTNSDLDFNLVLYYRSQGPAFIRPLR